MSLTASSIPVPMQASRQDGFSLLEVLVALLVISISLLGVAGMQAISLSNAGESGFRSIAATQAASMASAMSANWGYWQNQVADPASIVVNGASVSFGSTSQAVVNCAVWQTGSVDCSPFQMALYDLSQWGQQLQTALPSGTATITCSYSALNSCLIQVAWVEKNNAQNQSSTATANAGSAYHLDVMVQP